MRRLIVALGVVAGLVTAAEGAAPDLQPHRAVYDVGIGVTASGSPIIDAEGRMVIEWRRDCNGWTVEQQAVFDAYGPEGDTVRTQLSYSSWEADDGRTYDFTMRHVRDDEEIERLRGRARLDAERTGGASFAEPRGHEAPLPSETWFPTSHTRALLEHARRGERLFVTNLFLGQRLDEPFLASAVISDRVHRRTHSVEAAHLLDVPAWRFDIAFFPTDDGELPEFELAETVHVSGVVSHAEVSYGDFSFVYRLRHLEALPQPRC